MIERIRASFAAKLLLGGLLLSLLIIGGVSAYLLISRNGQTQGAALSNADNRAAVMRQVLLRFTGAQALSSAESVARQPALGAALASADPATTVPALFAGSARVNLADQVLVVADATGSAVYSEADQSVGRVSAAFSRVSAIGVALRGGTCGLGASGPVAGACGVDVLGGALPVYAAAVPVTAGGRLVGVVAYVAPLAYQLDRFNALFQFPTAFIPAAAPGIEIRQRSGHDVVDVAPAAARSAVDSGRDIVHAVYLVPGPGGSMQDVAGSFAAMRGPDGHTVAGYLGVEVPLSQFVGDERTDELTLSLITLFALLVTALAVILFVERVVRRPIRRLERGVARIAGGDYASDIDVRSRDELGRLAAGVNRMRGSIQRYTTEIEAARGRLDRNVEVVSDVSRALTTTTGGEAALQREVVRAAAAVTGSRARVLLAVRDGDGLIVRAAHPEGAGADLAAWGETAQLIRGTPVRRADGTRDAVLGLPMFHQARVVGALIISGEGLSLTGDEERVLAALVNNAAIAMENARLYEQERETVRRLRELDIMKTDFLSTVQHELRTPLTAIIGLSDLIDMCWTVWQDTAKLEAVHDIQIAARNLYEIVETIIDFSAVDTESLSLSPEPVAVDRAVTSAVERVAERYKGGLPVPVDADVAGSLLVFADAERFGQVLRALIDNAVKFSEGSGRVQVRASATAGGDHVRIEVVDHGIGIRPADLPRIFDRFFQADSGATRKHGGTGMGLALVKRLADAHGATVRVETEVGAGTSVVLEWPAASAAPPGEDASVGGAPPSPEKAATPLQ